MFTQGEKVTWHRKTQTGKDSYNRPIFGFEDVELENVAVAPGSTSEPRHATNLNRLKTELSIFLNPDPGIGEGDEFTVRGRRYEVEGEVSGAWVNPFTGSNFGAEINLRRVTG